LLLEKIKNWNDNVFNKTLVCKKKRKKKGGRGGGEKHSSVKKKMGVQKNKERPLNMTKTFCQK
jgi:hypothetical protein